MVVDVLITIITLVMVILVWLLLYDSNRFVIRNYQVKDERIRKSVRGVLLADLHNKSYGKNNEKLLAAIDEVCPDFILVAGDILTAKPGKSMAVAVDVMKALAEKYPVYYGNGNHEQRIRLYPKTYGDMAERYANELAKIGIIPMVNSHVTLPEYGITIYGAEIDRIYYKRFTEQQMSPDYLPGILGQVDSKFYNVLLAHNPDYFPQYAQWGADLVCAGHVHGGMIRIPFWGKGVVSPRVNFFPKYDGGVFTEDKATMILSRGLGMHDIPIRLFNPGELIVIDLGNDK